MNTTDAVARPEAVVFDAYGTLFDVHSAVGRYRERLGEDADGLSALWRTKQLEYTWLRSLMGCHADFLSVTSDALDYAFNARGISDPALQQTLLEACLEPEAFPEVPGVLDSLRRSRCPAAVLSNGTPEMLERAARRAGISGLLDAVLSVEAVGVFKPHPDVYRIGTEAFGAAADRLLFVSANAWDVAGAGWFGYRTAWVNRYGQSPERLPGRPDVELPDLKGLPEVLGLGRQGD